MPLHPYEKRSLYRYAVTASVRKAATASVRKAGGPAFGGPGSEWDFEAGDEILTY